MTFIEESNDTISLCMIVKNEEKNIERCLKSVANLVDEIIIVDTGSTDKTLDLPRTYGAKIFHYEWDNNFSRARNMAIEQAKGDWILVMDADEEIEENSKNFLRDAIDYDNGVANFLFIIDRFRGASRCQNAQPRLFRNHKNISYRKPVADNIFDSLELLVTEQQREFRVYPIYINHFSSENDEELIKRTTRNIELLNVEFNSPETYDKDKPYYLLKMINYYKLLGVKPEQIFPLINQAFSIISYNPDRRTKEMLYETDNLYIHLHVAEYLIMLKKFDSALQVINAGLKGYPDSLNLNFLLFNIHMAMGNKQEGLRIIKECKNLIDNFKYFKYEQIMIDILKSNIEKFYQELTNP